MYDEPDDEPDPAPCPLCEDPLSYNDECEMCKLATRASDAEYKLHTFKRSLGCRARAVAAQGFYLDGVRANGINPRLLQALATVYALADMPVPAPFLKAAISATLPEYGEYVDADHDEALMTALEGEHAADVEASKGLTFTSDVLDRRAATHDDQLWFLSMMDGTDRVATAAEKRSGGIGQWSGGTAPSWGSTLREIINHRLDAADGMIAFWCEVYLAYTNTPAEFKDGAKVTYVVGDTAYTANVGTHYTGSFIGFGGSKFNVHMKDGRQFQSNNNWHRGTIPVPLRKLLAPNAEFIKEAAPAAA